MAIAKMKKFMLLTFRSKKDSLLKDLQRFGDVHFRDLSRDELEEMAFLRQEHSQTEIVRLENELDRVKNALSRLAPYHKKGGITEKRPTLSFEEFDRYLETYGYKEVCAYIKEQDDVIASIKAETARLKSENESLMAWERLDAAPSLLAELTIAKYLLGTVNKMSADTLRENLEEHYPDIYIEFLGAVKDDMSVFILTGPDSYEDVFSLAKDKGFSRFIPSFSDVPGGIIQGNTRKTTELYEKAEQARKNIESRGGEYAALMIARDCLATIVEREKAAQGFMASETALFIEGWVPAEDEDRFMQILNKNCGDEFYLEKTDVELDSTDVPIKLKNNGFVSAFESITSMYSMPRYNEYDATPLLAPFYWLFFGLMVGDIGYGLILMIGTFLVLKLVDLKQGIKNFIRFFFYLSFAVILAGALYGGIFGHAVITPIPVLDESGVQLIVDGKPVFKAILDSQLDIVTMIVASIVLGLVHVLFGVAVKGALCIKRGDIAGAIFDSLLWILAVVSGVGMILGAVPGLIPAVAGKICMWVFYGSLIGLACTQGRSSPGIGGKIGNGLYGVYGITGYVGDLVSYTRIVALALSGSYIAFSFNLMSSILPAGFVRVVFGFIIVFLGQSLNFGLALLGAYVHTCRLQYVEYFGKFYEGGGVPFRPFTLKHDSIHIKN